MAAGAARSGWLSQMAAWLRRGRHASHKLFPLAEENASAAQRLKEVVERKRRYEQVRQREFDHLRQLRSRGIGVRAEPVGSQLSLFDSVLSLPTEDRQQTLRKIDRAEAQMARQRRRTDRVAGQVPPLSAVPVESAGITPPGPDIDSGFVPTRAFLPGEAEAPLLTPQCDDAPPLMPERAVAPGVRLTTEEVPDPEMERAALCLALGDLEAAARGLLAALRSASVPGDAGDLWRMALRELLRAGLPPGALQVEAGRASGGADGRLWAAVPDGVAGPALVGVLGGDIDALLATLGLGYENAPVLRVSCARLIRLDFAAAGCLLGWVQDRQARGCRVQFQDVSPLVATFLRMVGLSEQAQIVQRVF